MKRGHLGRHRYAQKEDNVKMVLWRQRQRVTRWIKLQARTPRTAGHTRSLEKAMLSWDSTKSPRRAWLCQYLGFEPLASNTKWQHISLKFLRWTECCNSCPLGFGVVPSRNSRLNLWYTSVSASCDQFWWRFVLWPWHSVTLPLGPAAHLPRRSSRPWSHCCVPCCCAAELVLLLPLKQKSYICFLMPPSLWLLFLFLLWQPS